jgi:CHRD domain
MGANHGSGAGIQKTGNGVVATGSFTNPALVAAIQANPQNFYVNVHSTTCMPGVIRGQLDDRGPLNN